MPRNAAFSDALSKVSSDKIKERSEGMESLRTIFQSQTSVENLSSVTEGAGWLTTFQTLFGVVKMERNNATRKGKPNGASSSSAAETRLSNAMSLVRWLVERSLIHLNKKVINALFSHLTQTIITSDGKLLRNSMDYIKALKTIVSYTPHLEHFPSASWESLMSICWDAALGKRIEYSKEEWTTGDLDEGSVRGSESEEEEEDVVATPSMGTTQKRKFTSTMSSITQRGSKSGKNPDVPPLSTEITELIGIVPILLSVPNAPILPPPQLPESDHETDKPLPRVGIRILHKTIKFLRERPAETTAHRPVLMTLNIVLGELELNAVPVMIETAPTLLSLLVPLWHTKLKDQVVLALRIILPFLSSSPFVCDKEPEEKKISREVFGDLLALRDAISRSTPGKRSHILDLSFLSLKIRRPSAPASEGHAPTPMHTPLISATSDIPDAMIMTWATLELMSDSLALLHQHHEASSLRSTTPSTGSNKRQRIEEPVAEMLSVMASARHVESRLFALQTMYFFVLRHWGQLHTRLQITIKNTMQDLNADPVPEVQQWADLNLAAICHLVTDNMVQDSTSGLVTRQTQAQGRGDWLETWQLALRKLIVTAGASSRSAALLLQVILQKQVIEPVLIITSIGKFLEGVSDQGPAAPYDAVCDFMVMCLDAADQDARLHRMGFTSKVSEWFRTAWLAQQKSTAEAADRATFELGSAFRLIRRLSGVPVQHSDFSDDRPLTSTQLFVRMQKEGQILDIRDFVLHSRLPALPATDDSRSRPQASGDKTISSDATTRPYTATEARALSRVFGLKLQQLSLTDADATNVARLRGKLDGCILILLVESSFIDSDPEHSQTNFDAASELLENMLQLALQKNWTLGERAKLFAGVNALFPRTRSVLHNQDRPAEELVCLPGYASGILSVITTGAKAREGDQQDATHIDVSPLHVRLWQKPKLCDIFRSRVRDFYQMLQGDELHLNGDAMNPGLEDVDDDFDAIKVDDDMGISSVQNDARVVEAIVTGCIRYCLLPKYCANGMSAPVKDRNILNILIKAEPTVFLQLYHPILLNVQTGLLEFNDEAALSIYEVLQDYLSSYTYSLSSTMRQAAAKFVNTILSRLSPLNAESFHTGAGELVAIFLDWLGANLAQGKLLFWEERLSIIRLFARLVELDPRNQAWSNRTQNDSDDDIADPVLLLCKLVDDSDARIRYRLSVVVARLFQWLPNRDFNALYRDVLVNYQTRGFQVEYILSMLVFQFNVTIVNAVGRFNALFHIYDTAYSRTFARNHIQVSLQSVVQALQLSGISELYLQYAARIAMLQLQEDENPEDLPMQLYGFSTRKQWAKAALTAVGSAALLKGKTWVWEHLSATVGLSKEEGLQLIFSATVGNHLAFEFDAMMPERSSDQDWAAMSQILREFEKKFTASGGKGKLELNPIDMISSIIFMPGDADTTQDLETLLQSQENGAERSRVFTEIYCTGGSARELEAVLVPVTSTRACIRVIQWIEMKHRQMQLDTIIYNVLMQIAGKLNTKILINERVRLIRNLAFFVAYYHHAFLESPILGFVLLRTGAVLAQHHDLVPISANLISWILPRMKFVRGADGDLVSMLARLSAVAMSYMANPDIEGINGLKDAGGRILTTLEAFLDLLWRRAPANIRPVEFLPLLPIWPRTLPKTPNKRLLEMTRAELLEKAQESAIHTQVFSLTSQLASKSGVLRDSEIDIFSSRVFWQLKDALSGETAPSPDELSAFLEFCYSNGGRIRMIDPDTYAALRTKTFRGRSRASSGRSDPTQSTSDILFAIFDRLSSADLGILHSAYHSLCIVGSGMSAAIQHVGLPSVVQAELGLLHARAPSQQIDDAGFMAFIGSDSPSEINLALPLETDRWVSMFASAACMQYAIWDSMLVDVASLFEHDRRLSRQLLPQILHLVLDKEAVTSGTESGPVRDALSTYLRCILQSSQLPLATKTVVIDILLYLRRQGRPGSYNHINNDTWLNLDFSVIAKAALDCKMYATALLYWELHVDPDNGSTAKVLGESDYHLLYDIYNNIDEPDGFYGIPLEGDVKHSLLQRFQHESNWSLAFKYYGAELEANGHSAHHLPQLTRSLQAFGMDKLALMLFQAEESLMLPGALHRLPYDLAWRTRSWDLPVSAFLPDSSDRSIYTALRTIHRSRDLMEIQRTVQVIEREDVESVRVFSLEDVHGLRKKMQELLSLREIKRWTGEYLPKIDSAKPADHEYEPFLEVPSCIEPQMTEQILFVRLSLIRSARSQDEWQLGDMMAERGRVLLGLERQCLQQLGLLARQRENLNGAIKILAEQQSLTPSDAADHVSEFAEVLWMQGDHGLAIDQLKNTLALGGSSTSRGNVRTGAKLSPVMESKLLSRVGQWMAEAKQAHPEVIYEDYFTKAYELMEEPGTKPFPEDRAIIYSRFAGFADQEYAQLLQLSELEQRHLVQQRFASDTAEREVAPVAFRKGSAAPSSRRTQASSTGQLDEYAVIKEFEVIKRKYLQYAIVMYARSMRFSDKYDDSVHRMCALWLENSSDNVLNIAIEHNILRVPTHKFAFLASQLTARLDDEDHKTKFQPALQALLKNLCEEHPFHIMYQVITLARPVQISPKTHTSARGGKTPRGVNGRELAASNLLDHIRALPRRTAQISDMQRFADASISWCDFRQDRLKTRDYQLPLNVPLAKIQDLCIPVPTQHLPFDISGDYKPSDKNETAFIQSYERSFGLAGGMHVPKIMVCLGHNGKRFRQLFKGDDDLRQDSVMEQVFGLVNTLLQRDEATAKRELRFKTYIVLPLANSTGIIEFVPDSIGIGDWLGEAHKRQVFRPGDMSPAQFRNDMKAIQTRDSNAHTELIKAFLANLKKFKPVMRHFFTDMRNDPIGWYAMRLKYARSVAVGSMVGHLVGLGDRHCSNIMINTKTGEILHIDLGIAFDQGADLNIPERVPFRLTQDMIDGLGSFGVEGVFIRCCEQTLRLLREKADLILAVLEVFRHDPLQKWKADFDKVNQMQGGAAAKAHKLKMEAHASELATSALDRVRTKLLSNQSVEYTVNELIRTATDPVNLATIYHGWQPWM